eukprot:gene10392-11474_t
MVEITEANPYAFTVAKQVNEPLSDFVPLLNDYSVNHTNSLLACVHLNDFPALCLIDTGADMSVISAKFWKSIPAEHRPSLREAHRERIVSNLTCAHDIARQSIVKSQASVKKYYDQRATDPDFTVGDKVWVYTPKVPKGLTKKLKHLWHGPYRISQQLSAVHFQLSTFDNRRVTTKVHANRLKLFYDRATRPIGIITNDVLDEYLSPEDMPTDSFDDPSNSLVPKEPTVAVIPEETSILNDDMYTVERILASRTRGGKIQYLIKWSGYPSSANTWNLTRIF